jgi:hypothetical protein
MPSDGILIPALRQCVDVVRNYMTTRDKINNCRNLLVTKLFEPSENDLVIEVCLGIVSNIEEASLVGNVKMTGRRVIFDENNERYTIHFENYIVYRVLNESYDNIGNDGEFSGDRIREYTISNFIDYCKTTTLAFQINSNESVKHYQLITSRHIIDVLTVNEYKIR